MIEFKIQRCKARYEGETERSLYDRICEHIGDLRTRKFEKTVAKNFNLPVHSLSGMTVTILEKVKVNDQQDRRERENYFVRKLNTFYGGSNLKPCLAL